MGSLLAFSLFGFDLTAILSSIDWNHVVGFILAAIGGGGVLNVASSKGWMGKLLERFRGNAAAAPATPTAEPLTVAKSIEDPASEALADGLYLLRQLDDVFKARRVEPAERRKRFLAGVDSLLEPPVSTATASGSGS